MLESIIPLLLALFLGLLAGTIAGLLPGIHINLVSALLISFSLFFLQFTQPIILVIFIVTMAISQTFIDFIPSIFLGAPDEETVLSVLPGHELLKKGQGYKAILLTNYGCLAGIFLVLLISPLFLLFLPKIYNIINILIPYILILVTLFLIFSEEKKLISLLVILLAGFLGIAVLNLDMKEPLLPLLTGLFGSSSLIISIKSKIKIPKQKIEKPQISRKFFKPLLASLIASPLCSFLPGVGSGQAAIIGNTLAKTDREGFLFMLGAINVIVMGLSFVVLYSIGKGRTGAAVAISKILEEITSKQLIIILAIILLIGIICFYLTIFLTKIVSDKIHKINYSLLSIIVLIFLCFVIFFFSGFFGFLVFIVSTATGLFGILSGVKRINLMSCLLIPTILIYLL